MCFTLNVKNPGYILALNFQGVILHEGVLNSVDFWETVAAVAGGTAETSHKFEKSVFFNPFQRGRE